MFKPKTFLDLCMAMKTRAEVEFDTLPDRGIITQIEITGVGEYKVTLDVPLLEDDGVTNSRTKVTTRFYE